MEGFQGEKRNVFYLSCHHVGSDRNTQLSWRNSLRAISSYLKLFNEKRNSLQQLQ